MYVLDIKIGPFEDSPSTHPNSRLNSEFYVKIDISGNVDIKKVCIRCNYGVSGGSEIHHSTPIDILLIKDNIPIPSELLNTIKSWIDFPIQQYSYEFNRVVDQIKKIKDDLKVKKYLKIKEDREKDELKLRNETLEKELKELKKQVLKLERNMIMNKMIYNEDTDTFEA